MYPPPRQPAASDADDDRATEEAAPAEPEVGGEAPDPLAAFAIDAARQQAARWPRPPVARSRLRPAGAAVVYKSQPLAKPKEPKSERGFSPNAATGGRLGQAREIGFDPTSG